MIKFNILLVAAATTLSMSAMAAPMGTWSGSIGAGYVSPTSDNGSLLSGTNALGVDVDSNTRPTVTGEYFFADNVGVELLAAIPFQHDITLTDTSGTKIDAETKHLPPTLSLQYHFDNLGAMMGTGMNIEPFVGIGVNYTNFFDEEISLAGSNLDIDDTFGIAGHIGVDFPLSTSDAIRVDARYLNIEPDVELNGSNIGSVEINPWVYGVSYVRNF